MADPTPSANSAPHSIADGLTTTDVSESNDGYVASGPTGPQVLRRLMPGNFIQEDDEPSDEEVEDQHEDHETEDTLDDPEPLNSSNPADFTKSYNRQKRLNETMGKADIAPWERPKSNPQKSSKLKLGGFAKADELSYGYDEPSNPTNIKGKESLPSASQDRDKSDRATVEQVLDPKTRTILFQMINSDIVTEINGAIATGKEANVYHGMSASEDGSAPDVHVAIKVYKTSILVFKDREKYVTGEFRFRKTHKGDNRAMVKMWALKEMRNLKRLNAAGVPSPEPLYLRRHVLGMTLIGDSKGKAAPRLKDVVFEDEVADAKWRTVYIDILAYMRIILQQCKLVHADLSQYNILWYDNKPYIIDVSQSVESDHPHSLDFLRMDIKNVSDFFKRKGVSVLSDKQAYTFITNLTGLEDLSLNTLQTEIDKIMSERTDADDDNELENEVFRRQYIPQTLDEVYDAERDAEGLHTAAGREALVYKDLLAPSKGSAKVSEKVSSETTDKLNSSLSKVDITDEGDTNGEVALSHTSDSAASDTGSNDTESESVSGTDSDSDFDTPSTPRGKRFQDKDAKRDHKKKVKEEKREKRATKMPKAVKKKLVTQKARHKH